MSRSFRERDVTIIEFAEDYDSLDYQTLEAIGELLLSEATGADPPKLILDLSGIWFLEYVYADGNSTQFGAEYRANLAWSQRLITGLEKKLRFDGILEANYLSLGRDRTNGEDELGTGGQILYLQPGARFYARNFSAAVGVKFPAWTDLNKEDLQQGAEGTEDYRIEFTFSTLF